MKRLLPNLEADQRGLDGGGARGLPPRQRVGAGVGVGGRRGLDEGEVRLPASLGRNRQSEIFRVDSFSAGDEAEVPVSLRRLGNIGGGFEGGQLGLGGEEKAKRV